MTEKSQTFLGHRARAFQKLSEGYRQLEELCQRMQLTPLSGDVTPLTLAETVGLTGRPTYWPFSLDIRGDQNVIELQHHGQMVLRLTVNSAGYYGCNRFGEGNHDWDIGELEALVTRTLQREETEHAGVRDSQGDLGQDAGEE